MRPTLVVTSAAVGSAIMAYEAFLANMSSPVLTVIAAVMMTLPLMTDWVRPPDAVEAPAPRPSVPAEEPVDTCAHDDEPAAPIEVDWDSNGSPEVIGWLCTACGAKVSPHEALRRNNPSSASPDPADPAYINHLRAAIQQVCERLEWRVSRWQADSPVLHVDENEYRLYQRDVDEAERLRERLRAAEKAAEALRDSGIRCTGYIEVAGRLTGTVARRYAVPGECLCGACKVEAADRLPAAGGDTP